MTWKRKAARPRRPTFHIGVAFRHTGGVGARETSSGGIFVSLLLQKPDVLTQSENGLNTTRGLPCPRQCPGLPQPWPSFFIGRSSIGHKVGEHCIATSPAGGELYVRPPKTQRSFRVFETQGNVLAPVLLQAGYRLAALAGESVSCGSAPSCGQITNCTGSEPWPGDG